LFFFPSSDACFCALTALVARTTANKKYIFFISVFELFKYKDKKKEARKPLSKIHESD
jgi:hypothetical protein